MKSDRKKIVVFIDWYKPAFLAGGPIQSVFNIVKSLEKTHYFFICTSNKDLRQDQPLHGIEVNKWIQFSENSEVIYLPNKDQDIKNYQSIIQATDCDSVYLNSVFSVSFTIKPLLALKSLNKKTIIAPRGMLGKGALSLKPWKKRIFLKAAKVLGLFKNVLWHVSSENEKNEVHSRFGQNSNTQIAKNIPNIPSDSLTGSIKTPNKLILFSLARISKVKNIHFALECLTQAFKGEIIFNFYGPVTENDYWEKCQTVIKRLPSNVKVEYKGSLNPNEVHEEISKSHFLFLPTTNENYGHVIIESFLAGKPVIISDQTPWNELQEKGVGWDIDLSEKAKFRETLELCLQMNDDEYQKMSQRCSAFGKKSALNNEDLEANIQLFS